MKRAKTVNAPPLNVARVGGSTASPKSNFFDKHLFHFPTDLSEKSLAQTSSAVDLTVVDLVLDLAWVLTIDRATNGDACSEDLLDGALELGGVGLWSELLGNLDDLIELHLAVVDWVLDLLSVTWWFLEGLQDQWGSGWEDGNMALSVLHHNFNENLDSFPLESSFLDIFTDLLWWETEWTALGGESSSSRNFTADDLQIDVLLLVGINCSFWWHN